LHRGAGNGSLIVELTVAHRRCGGIARRSVPRRRNKPTSIANGDCVRLRDGRIARVRQKVGTAFKLRVRRKTSATHQFLLVSAAQLEPVACPDGWMSPAGYRRYLRQTLRKMRERKRHRDG
jgi:hypothetical protein